MAEVASRWIENGATTEFTHWHRQEASRRQVVAKEILTASLKQTQPSSYHLWLKLPDNWQADKFTTCAKEGGCGGAVRDEFQHRYFFARRGGASLSGTAG